MEIGKAIKELRKLKGLTQNDLAKMIGKSLRMIQKYEDGAVVPSIKQLQRIANALNVSIDNFIFPIVECDVIPSQDINCMGLKISELRKKKNLTQEKLASLAGIGKMTISQYERGRRQPKIEQLIKIANVLNVGIEKLIDSSDNFQDKKVDFISNQKRKDVCSMEKVTILQSVDCDGLRKFGNTDFYLEVNFNENHCRVLDGKYDEFNVVLNIPRGEDSQAVFDTYYQGYLYGKQLGERCGRLKLQKEIKDILND